jgi:hypothetical protein
MLVVAKLDDEEEGVVNGRGPVELYCTGRRTHPRRDLARPKVARMVYATNPLLKTPTRWMIGFGSWSRGGRYG